MRKTARYIELIDEIRNHVFQWATDDDWGKLPPKVNVAMTTLINELKIAQALKEAGETDTDEESITNEKRKFISLFKKKYLETCAIEFKQPISPVHQVNISRTITDLKKEGGNYVEFIEWFFDDFCALEENKKFMPPEINFVCSNHIVTKYLYIMKDKLRIRKNNISKEAVRTMLLDIALAMQKRIKRHEFAQKIIEFDNEKISASKFFALMQAFADKYNDEEGKTACINISEKMASIKKDSI